MTVKYAEISPENMQQKNPAALYKSQIQWDLSHSIILFLSAMFYLLCPPLSYRLSGIFLHQSDNKIISHFDKRFYHSVICQKLFLRAVRLDSFSLRLMNPFKRAIAVVSIKHKTITATGRYSQSGTCSYITPTKLKVGGIPINR